MALPKELEPYAKESGIGTYARVLRGVLRDLAKASGHVHSVEVLSKADQRSALRKFFALEKATDADHWLAVNATVLEREVRLLAPFRRGLTLPYSIEITLDAPLEVLATYRRGLIRRAEWIVEPSTPANRNKPKQLEALELPDIGWRHDSGGIPILLSEGARIGVSAGAGHRRVTWTVFSAYQGFLFNVGPRITKYVRAAPQLETLLADWLKEQPAPEPVKAAGRVVSKPPKPEPQSELEKEAEAMLNPPSSDPSSAE